MTSPASRLVNSLSWSPIPPGAQPATPFERLVCTLVEMAMPRFSDFAVDDFLALVACLAAFVAFVLLCVNRRF